MCRRVEVSAQLCKATLDVCNVPHQDDGASSHGKAQKMHREYKRLNVTLW